MRKWLLVVFLILLGCYKGYHWFDSPAYFEFLERHKKESWFAGALLKSGLYWTFADEPRKALVYFNRCMEKDLEKSPQRSSCLYYKAASHDQLNQRAEAIRHYSLLFQEFPNHPKASIASRRMDFFKSGL
ncbi:MAG: hypothetical protein HY401_05545 [Elusimicrobia bacterium]|nr:hypothetical protein [Elusimicrobiota bacterium]